MVSREAGTCSCAICASEDNGECRVDTETISEIGLSRERSGNVIVVTARLRAKQICPNSGKDFKSNARVCECVSVDVGVIVINCNTVSYLHASKRARYVIRTCIKNIIVISDFMADCVAQLNRRRQLTQPIHFDL